MCVRCASVAPVRRWAAVGGGLPTVSGVRCERCALACALSVRGVTSSLLLLLLLLFLSSLLPYPVNTVITIACAVVCAPTGDLGACSL